MINIPLKLWIKIIKQISGKELDCLSLTLLLLIKHIAVNLAKTFRHQIVKMEVIRTQIIVTIVSALTD